MQHPRREHVTILRLLIVLVMVVAANVNVPSITQATTGGGSQHAAAVPAAHITTAKEENTLAPRKLTDNQVHPALAGAPTRISALSSRVPLVLQSHAKAMTSSSAATTARAHAESQRLQAQGAGKTSNTLPLALRLRNRHLAKAHYHVSGEVAITKPLALRQRPTGTQTQQVRHDTPVALLTGQR